jgi:hypothetical protein
MAMPGTFDLIQQRPIEYSMLFNAKPSGISVGYYLDRPISEAVIDEFGRRFVFAGIAPRRFDGQFDTDALRPGEFIVEPGLIYRLERKKAPWLDQVLRAH